MEYRIISADSTKGQILVTYLHESLDVGTFAIDVPIVENKYITGDELHQEIIHRAPVWVIERNLQVQAAQDFEKIEALVVSLPSVEVPQEVSVPVWGSVNVITL